MEVMSPASSSIEVMPKDALLAKSRKSYQPVITSGHEMMQRNMTGFFPNVHNGQKEMALMSPSNNSRYVASSGMLTNHGPFTSHTQRKTRNRYGARASTERNEIDLHARDSLEMKRKLLLHASQDRVKKSEEIFSANQKMLNRLKEIGSRQPFRRHGDVNQVLYRRQLLQAEASKIGDDLRRSKTAEKKRQIRKSLK